MTNPSKYEKNAEELAEAHSSLGGFIFGTLVELIAIWKEAFKALSQSFYILNWVNEGLMVMWRTLALQWSYNKNMHQSGNLMLSWLQFAFSTLMVFGGVILVGIAEIAAFGVMLLLNPFICFVKAIYYLGKTIAADNLEEAEAHYSRLKENLAATLISAILGLCLAALLYLPALPASAVITLTTVVCVTILPPIIIGLGSKLISLLSSLASSIAKGWRKICGLVGPGNYYDFRSGKGIKDSELEKNIIYIDKLGEDDLGHQFLSYRFQNESEIIQRAVFKQHNLPTDNLYFEWPRDLSDKEVKKLRPQFDLFATSLLQASKPTTLNLTPIQPAVHFKPKLSPKSSEVLPPCILKEGIPSKALENYHTKEREDYHAHLSAPALQSIEELVAEAARLLNGFASNEASFFQDAKRQNKIEAVKVFASALTQWNNLYQNRVPTTLEYHSIILDKDTEISRILNPHQNLNISADRERVIKNIEKYILHKYPDAYQSFFREQGSVATLFQQGFDLMRRMKTDVEIDQEKSLIGKKIDAYEQRYDGIRGYFVTEDQQRQHQERADLLRGYFNGNKTAEQIEEDPEFKSSRMGQGADWQLCERIKAFHGSEKMLNSTDVFSCSI